MADCRSLSRCPFLRIVGDMPGMLDLYERRYCRRDGEDCARHLIELNIGFERVPADLFPNDVAQADYILMENGLRI